MKMRKLILLVIATEFLLKIGHVESHVRLNNPPARSTAWREDPINFPSNYNDYEMNCGGKSVQWDQNGILFRILLIKLLNFI